MVSDDLPPRLHESERSLLEFTPLDEFISCQKLEGHADAWFTTSHVGKVFLVPLKVDATSEPIKMFLTWKVGEPAKNSYMAVVSDLNRMIDRQERIDPLRRTACFLLALGESIPRRDGRSGLRISRRSEQ